MPVSVYIPTPFRRLTANREYVEAEGANVLQVLDALEAAYPGLGDLVFDADHRVPTHINIYLNNQEIPRPRRHGNGRQGRRPVSSDPGARRRSARGSGGRGND